MEQKQTHSIINSITVAAADFVFELFKEELSPEHLYHNFQHTSYVVGCCSEMAEYYELSEAQQQNLLLAAWFHDTGFTKQYIQHENASVLIAQNFLKRNQYAEKDIRVIIQLITSTHPEIKPKSLLEEILHDADVCTLVQSNFEFQGAMLRKEWELLLNKQYTDSEWSQIRYQFLLDTQFYTRYGQERYDRSRKDMIKILKKRPSGTDSKIDETAKKKFKDKRTGRGIETMYRVTYRNHINLTAIADRKANMMMSINTIILSAVVAIVSSSLAYRDMFPEYYRFSIPLAILLLGSLSSVIFAILSARPQVTHLSLNQDRIRKKKASVLYFGNFASLPLEDYLSDMDLLRTDEELLYNSMSIDLYYLGRVLTTKYKQLKISYNLFMIGLILTVVSLASILIYSRYISSHPLF